MLMLWDNPKRELNIRTQRLDSVDARERFEWDSALVGRSHPRTDGRERFHALGLLDGRLVTLIISILGTEAISAISMLQRAARKGSSMKKRKASLPPLSDAEEAEIQAGIARDPDNPELTDEQLAAMRPAKDVLPPALFEALTRRGRPASPNKRVQVTLRLDPEALAAFRATGPGWQGRINDAVVRGAAKLRRSA